MIKFISGKLVHNKKAQKTRRNMPEIDKSRGSKTLLRQL